MSNIFQTVSITKNFEGKETLHLDELNKNETSEVKEVAFKTWLYFDTLLNEENQLTWFPLGDTNEYYLKNTLSLIETGSMPDILQTEEKQQSVHAHYNSIEAQNCQGVILSTQK